MTYDLPWLMKHEQSDVITSSGIVEYTQAILSLSPSAVTGSILESRNLNWVPHQPGPRW